MTVDSEKRRKWRAQERKSCERSERLKVLGRGSYGVRLGCGVRAWGIRSVCAASVPHFGRIPTVSCRTPWANTYGVLAVGESPFTKGLPPLVRSARAQPSGEVRFIEYWAVVWIALGEPACGGGWVGAVVAWEPLHKRERRCCTAAVSTTNQVESLKGERTA